MIWNGCKVTFEWSDFNEFQNYINTYTNKQLYDYKIQKKDNNIIEVIYTPTELGKTICCNTEIIEILSLIRTDPIGKSFISMENIKT